MAGERDENVVLDCAIFETSPTQNSYEVLVCSKGKIEKLTAGPLDQLAFHLREASSQSDNSFKLQVSESLKDSSWFTKFTLARFLHIVGMPEVVKAANAIENEMFQLEETRRFHLSIYAKGHLNHSGGGTADCSEKLGLTQKIKVETALSDASKNELLRAMDLRLTALKEELGASFNRAAGAMCSPKQISDIAAFAEHFGATDLRNFLSRYLELISKDQPDQSAQSTFSHDLRNSEHKTEEISLLVQQPDIVKPLANGVSPAKIAQAERQNSTESEESSESSNEDHSFAERSRPLIRSASPRRSASPMRRIQIGRSGSRRSTALTIKSLNYFPPRERPLVNRDTDDANSGEESDQPPKKAENTVRRMSVQDAINLFERKQKDQNLDVQMRKTSAEVLVNTNKSVLRRWSAGMSDSFNHSSDENASDVGCQKNTSENQPLEEEVKKLNEVKAESDSSAHTPNPAESAQLNTSPGMENITSPPLESPESVIPKAEVNNDRATTSAEWNRQKEAELNQMLMKMMESKPRKYRGGNAVSGAISNEQKGGISSEQKGGFSSQYKEKRDEKRRSENARLQAGKEAQIKVTQETSKQIKAETASKTGGIAGKQDPLSRLQRPRRSPSPPVLPKKEVSKPTGSRKVSPRSSSLPATRSSWSSGPLPKTTGTPPAKPSPGTVSTNATPNCRKPQPSPSPSKASPRTERPVQQPKGNGNKGIRSDVKPRVKGQEEKQQKSATRRSRSETTKAPSAPGDDSGVKSAKPSFYNKVTKKSTVVPLESKPFLRKGAGIGPGVGPVLAKTKVSESDDSSKNSGNLVQAQETELIAVTAESATVVLEHDLLQTKVDTNLEVPPSVVDDLHHETTEILEASSAALENDFENPAEISVAEIQPEEDMGISSAAWVEVDHQEVSASCDNGLPVLATSPGIAPVASTSPRVRNSLSQMLQADSSEPDIIEWGNAENPPALVYQKDAPKGFKRLLKFARKNKGDAIATGWSSPSVFSEGEDDPGESKTFSKRTSDNRGMHDVLSAQSTANIVASLSSDKLREGHISMTTTSTKATRSFFSLSTFRSGKSSETKLR